MPLIYKDDGGIILDEEDETLPAYSPVCSFCAHGDESGARRCAAFPGGIPLPIWLGENDHRQPYPGDHGIQFEQWKEAASEASEAATAKA
jgi:hypothetical protein